MPFLGTTGKIAEVRRRGQELSVEWRINNFLLLSDSLKVGDYYESPLFGFRDGCWLLKLSPLELKPEWLNLFLQRKDTGPRKTIHFTFGLRCADKTRRIKTEKWGFSQSCYGFGIQFYPRSTLSNHGPTQMTDNVLIITLDMESDEPGIARGVSSYQDASTQTDGEFREPNTLTASQPLNKKAAFGNDAEKKNDGNDHDENNGESKNKKSVKQLSQVKKSKKISFPARHDNVIRSLKAILAEGRRADFTLKTGVRNWPVHRAILEGRSGHFETLFRGEWAERDEARFDYVTEGALDGVLHFVYAGEVADESVENVSEIYAAANEFLLEDLKSLCVEYMKEKMCPEMVCGALVIAETYGEGDLKETAQECFFRESRRIVSTEGWKELKENHPAIIGELFEEFVRKEKKHRRKDQE